MDNSSGQHWPLRWLIDRGYFWLMNTQARYKWAVLYYDLDPKRGVNFESVLADSPNIKQAVQEVAAGFTRSGFREARETQYLLSIGPSELDATDHARGWSAGRFQHDMGNLTSWEAISGGYA